MPFTKVSVLIPTRNRVHRLRKVLESFDETVHQKDAELVFRIDDDDVASQQFLHDQRVVVGPRYNGYDSMPTFFNEMHCVAAGDVLMCGNDDMIFRTPDWSTRILEIANQYPDGLFDIGVSTLNQDHFPFATVSRRVTNALGFLWDPRIFWGDIFLRDVMQVFDRCIMVPDVQIEHDWSGYSPDQVFVEADKDIVRRRPNYWAEIHAAAVRDAVNTLKEKL